MFMHLPVQIRNIIANREQDREKTLRRAQNELAKYKKLLRLQAAAETKAADNTTTEKENEMAKKQGYEKGIGPYSGQDDIKFTRKPAEFDPGKDISKQVDPSWERTDGFAAKLDKGKE